MNWLLKLLAKWRGVEICLGCNHIIDATICHCGELIETHNFWSGHSAVPAGCTCGYDKAERMKNTRFQLLKNLTINHK